MDVTVEIVILAMIAAFLGLRLYSVLGRRAEHEEEPIRGRLDREAGRRAGARASRRCRAQPPHSRCTATARCRRSRLPAVERGLREIAAADRRFDITAFLEGARGAYRMILEAFWRGDKDELAQLCDRDVYEGFATAIDARAAAGEVLDNRLVRIEETTIIGASYDAPLARVTVRFAADIATVTRDAAGTCHRRLARRCGRGARCLDLLPQRDFARSRLAARRDRRGLSAVGRAVPQCRRRSPRLFCSAACGQARPAQSNRPRPPEQRCAPGVFAGPAMIRPADRSAPMRPARSPRSARAARA